MRALLILACLAIAACSKAPSGGTVEKLRTFDVEEPAGNTPPPAPAGPAGSPAIQVSVPSIAYVYRYSFSLPGPSIGAAQDAHVALCDRLGPQRCQVLAMTSQNSDEQSAKATLKLRVASAIARRFGAELMRTVAKAGGRAVDRSIEAEDVSKDISDTTARLRQRELLVARLTEILRTHNGKVAELVEAERSVAAAQEEIDQAKGWLAELQGRVALSTIELSYDAVAPPTEHVGGGIADAVAGSLSGFVIGLGAIARVLIFLAPWALLGGLLWLGTRRVLPRYRRRRGGPELDADPS